MRALIWAVVEVGSESDGAGVSGTNAAGAVVGASRAVERLSGVDGSCCGSDSLASSSRLRTAVLK